MWACCQPGELPQAQGCFYFLGQETSLHGLFKIFLLFIFFFSVWISKALIGTLRTWTLSGATQYNTDHELLIVVPFPWWVTPREFSRDIIHMPKSIRIYPCWGLYLWQTRQKTPISYPTDCAGTRAQSWETRTVRVFPPAASSCSSWLPARGSPCRPPRKSLLAW